MDFGVKLKVYKVLFVIAVFISGLVKAQTLNAPTIGVACARPNDAVDFFKASFTAPNTLPLNTQYSLELSNKSGSFNSNTLILDRESPANNRVVTFSFNYPENDGTGETLASEVYRVRVIIENQTAILPGQASDRFYAYYYDNTTYNLLPRQLCSLGELRAEGDLDEYRWFKDGIEIPGETGVVLDVVEPGRYYYTPNFGSCNVNFSLSRSNDALVAENEGDLNINIIATGATNICAKDMITLQIDNPLPGFQYQWVKDNQEISGATNSSLNVTGIDAQGVYHLEVIDTNDPVSRCTSPSNDITVTLQNPSIEITSPLKIVSVPGVQNPLTVSVTGGSPRTISWFRNGIEIPNSNTETLLASLPGAYTAQITATSPCDINTVTTKETVVITAIDNLSLSIDYVIADNPSTGEVETAYSDCTFSEVRLQISEISSIVDGSKVLVSSANFEVLDIVWFRNGVVVEGLNGSSILLNNAFLNGSYQAKINVDGFSSQPESNFRNVKLNLGELQVVSSDNNLNVGETAILEVELPEGAPSSDITYKWFENNNETTFTTQQITVSKSGRYSAEVTFEGCTINTEPLTISAVSDEIPNVLTPNNGFNSDIWNIPLEYTNQPDVNVQIISASGKEVFNQNNYNGDWPNDELKETIYYYIISRNGKPEKKGTITIIR